MLVEGCCFVLALSLSLILRKHLKQNISVSIILLIDRLCVYTYTYIDICKCVHILSICLGTRFQVSEHNSLTRGRLADTGGLDVLQPRRWQTGRNGLSSELWVSLEELLTCGLLHHVIKVPGPVDKTVAHVHASEDSSLTQSALSNRAGTFTVVGGPP